MTKRTFFVFLFIVLSTFFAIVISGPVPKGKANPEAEADASHSGERYGFGGFGEHSGSGERYGNYGGYRPHYGGYRPNYGGYGGYPGKILYKKN